ncbi:hypothetical protein D3C73_854220 [compost metagenome]
MRIGRLPAVIPQAAGKSRKEGIGDVLRDDLLERLIGMDTTAAYTSVIRRAPDAVPPCIGVEKRRCARRKIRIIGKNVEGVGLRTRADRDE